MRNNTSVKYNLLLVIGDCLALIAAFSVAYILRVSVSHEVLSAQVHAKTYLMIILTLLPFWVLIFALIGLYKERYYENRFKEFARIIVACFIGILFVISYAYVANVKIFPARLVTIYAFGLALFFVFLFRTLARGTQRRLFNFGIGLNNVLVVGDTRITHELMTILSDSAATGYKILGVVGGVKHPLRPNDSFRQYSDFAAAVAALGADNLHTVIQTELYGSAEKNNEILTFAQEHHVAYRFVPGNDELFTGNIEVDLFHSIPIIAVNQTALVGWGRVIKRLFDLVIGSILLICSLPIMLIVVFLSLFDHGDPIFSQVRLSRFGKKVKIYKFRTQKHAYNRMTPEAGFAKMGRPELAEVYRQNGDFLPGDPRISAIGRFLRTSSLDELPQLFNVVRGDLSLVGPRPLEPFELEKYGQKNLILSVRSGMTGLAVISGRRDIPFNERRRLDLYYVQNWSFYNDLVILVKTIWIVIFHRGAR